jgi:hypothetical protein
MCEFLDDPVYQSSSYPFFVQRSWSNSRAFKGLEPCVPAPPDPYFYAAPIYSDAVTIPVTGTTIDATCVHIPAGTSKTIPVQLIGHGATGNMIVRAIDAAAMFGQQPLLDLNLVPNSGQPGDTLQLTITKNNSSRQGYSSFVFNARIGGRQSFYWGLTSD